MPCHSWKQGTLEATQTFSIDAVSAAIESFVNPEFTALLATGRYLYVESHFVLNSPKYLTMDDFENRILTDYARKNMEECALIFEVSVRNRTIERSSLLSCVLKRDKDAPFDLAINFHKGYENSSKEKQDEYLANVLEENAMMYAQLSNNPCDCLEKVLAWRGLTKQALAEKIPCDEKTIRRIFNGESSGSMATMVAICLAMFLPPEISFHIIEKSNLTFKFNDDTHKWCRFILQTKHGCSLDEIRAFLKSHNVPL